LREGGLQSKSKAFNRRRFALLAAAAVVSSVVLWAGPSSAAPSACGPLVEAFDAVLPQPDLTAITAAAGAVLDSGECRAATRARVGRLTALAHLRAARKHPGTADGLSAQLKLMEAGMRFGQPWQLMAELGGVREKLPNAAGRIDYKAASLAYQAALSDIADAASTPNPPPADEIRRLTRLAHQARMLASDFVSAGVLMTRDVRGIALDAVPVPIQFVRDRDEMTDLGRLYAEDTFKLLADKDRPRITLIGHTDPDGSDQYNLDLSLRRAQATKRYLVERGYDANAIEVAGRGRREPLKIENEKQYSQVQIYQMLRRVDVQFR
jgi:OOP family OmpA-OmpF porin